MHPVLAVGAWQVQSWGLLNALACIVVLLGALVGARFREVSRLALLRLWPWTILGGVLGAHLYWLLAGGEATASASAALDVLRGSAVQGGFVGGALGALAFLRLSGTPVLPALDVLAPAGAAAQALTRVGCFLAGCCYGRRAPAWLGVVYTDPASLGPRGVPLHAAQLYESALLLALAVVLAGGLRRRDVPNGRVFAAYLGGYGAIRFAVQLFRGDDADRLIAGLAHSQYAALVMIAVGGWLWHRTVSARRAPA